MIKYIITLAVGMLIGISMSRVQTTTPILTRNIEPQTQRVITPAENQSRETLVAWMNDPIQIYRNLSDSGVLSIRATDTHKETCVVDNIRTQNTQRNLVHGFPVVLFDGRRIHYGLGVGILCSYGSFVYGAQISFGSSFVSSSVSLGFSF